MKYSRLRVLAAIIASVILVSFFLSAPRARDGAKPIVQSSATSVPVVTLKDSFKKGVHTITGSLTATNACTTVTADASLSGDASSTIVVALSVPEDSGICLQVPTEESFSATVSAPARLPIHVTVNGVPATTTPL